MLLGPRQEDGLVGDDEGLGLDGFDEEEDLSLAAVFRRPSTDDGSPAAMANAVAVAGLPQNLVRRVSVHGWEGS